jgi:archaellum component FlaG (FlaF/FlaG flagellin family)
MLKAGEVTSVEFTSDKPYSSQLSGRVSASVTEDKAETVTLLFQKPGKNVLKKEAAIDVTVYKPDFKISNVFISGKETFEWVYPGDKLSLRPVIEYNGAIGLQKVRCVVTSSSQWVSGRASIVLGNLQVGKTMSGSQSRPELQVSASAPIGIEIPIDFTFTDSTERSWVVTYILKTGRSSFNIQMEDVYVIDDGNLKQPLEAAPGQVVQIGFDARNVGLTESPLVQASMEVIQGYGVAASKRISVPTTFKSNTLYSTASVTGGRLTLQVRPDALIGDRIVFRINIYSLMTLIKSQDFVLVVK